MNKKILVPVYETFIADMETPISIFQKYVGLVPAEMMEIDIKKVLEK